MTAHAGANGKCIEGVSDRCDGKSYAQGGGIMALCIE